MTDQNTIQAFEGTLSNACYQSASAFCRKWGKHGIEFLRAIPSGEASPFGVYALGIGLCYPLFNRLMCRFERNFQVAHQIEDTDVNRSLTGRQLLFKHLLINIVTPISCTLAFSLTISSLTPYKLNYADTLAIIATVIAVRLFLLRPLSELVPHTLQLETLP